MSEFRAISLLLPVGFRVRFCECLCYVRVSGIFAAAARRM
jgi:hypothetical protein